MESAVRKYVEQQAKNEREEIGRHQGRASAFEDMMDQLNPEKYCQDCGREYRTEDHSWGDTKEVHDSKCEARKNRMNAEREFYLHENDAPTSKS